jgi:hypothetical protein
VSDNSENPIKQPKKNQKTQKKNIFLCKNDTKTYPFNQLYTSHHITLPRPHPSMESETTTENELMLFVCTALNIQPHELQDGVVIPRDMLLSPEKYEQLKPSIARLKKIFSSKCMTSMHASAEYNQKWPCLNLVRQVLKRMGYDIQPERRCAGRDDDGKKLFERFFKVHKREKFTVAAEEE